MLVECFALLVLHAAVLPVDSARSGEGDSSVLFDDFTDPTTMLFTGGRIVVDGCNTDIRGMAAGTTVIEQVYDDGRNKEAKCCKLVVPNQLAAGFDYATAKGTCNTPSAGSLTYYLAANPIKRAVAAGQCNPLVSCIVQTKTNPVQTNVANSLALCPGVHGIIGIDSKFSRMSQCEALQMNNAGKMQLKIPFYIVEPSVQQCPQINKDQGFLYTRLGDGHPVVKWSNLSAGQFIFFNQSLAPLTQPPRLLIRAADGAVTKVHCTVDWVRKRNFWHTPGWKNSSKYPVPKYVGVANDNTNEVKLMVHTKGYCKGQSAPCPATAGTSADPEWLDDFHANIVVKFSCSYTTIETKARPAINVRTYLYYTSDKFETCTSKNRKICELPFWVDNKVLPKLHKGDLREVTTQSGEKKYTSNCEVTVRMCFPHADQVRIYSNSLCDLPTGTTPAPIFYPTYSYSQKHQAAKITFEAKKKSMSHLYTFYMIFVVENTLAAYLIMALITIYMVITDKVPAGGWKKKKRGGGGTETDMSTMGISTFGTENATTAATSGYTTTGTGTGATGTTGTTGMTGTTGTTAGTTGASTY